MRIIIIGSGNPVYFLSRRFDREDHHVTVINRNEVESRRLARLTNATVVQGDGTDLGVLEEAGVRRADLVLALTPHDEDNLVACQIVQRLYGVPRTLALVNDPDNEPVFQALGVHASFSATEIIASLIEQQANIEDAISLMPIAKGKVNVTDLSLDKESPAVGRTLAELSLGGNAVVACIIRNDEVVIPTGDSMLLVNDHLLIITTPQNHALALARLLGPRG